MIYLYFYNNILLSFRTNKINRKKNLMTAKYEQNHRSNDVEEEKNSIIYGHTYYVTTWTFHGNLVAWMINMDQGMCS